MELRKIINGVDNKFSGEGTLNDIRNCLLTKAQDIHLITTYTCILQTTLNMGASL